jgi:hypothetical protein
VDALLAEGVPEGRTAEEAERTPRSRAYAICTVAVEQRRRGNPFSDEDITHAEGNEERLVDMLTFVRRQGDYRVGPLGIERYKEEEGKIKAALVRVNPSHSLLRDQENITGTHSVARRMANAEERFLAFAQEQGLTREEAVRALAEYRKAKVIKFDNIGGQFTFVDGRFAEIDVLRRAAR